MSLWFIENATPLGAREKVTIFMSNWVKKNKLKTMNFRFFFSSVGASFCVAMMLPWLLFLYWKLSYTVKPTAMD